MRNWNWKNWTVAILGSVIGLFIVLVIIGVAIGSGTHNSRNTSSTSTGSPSPASHPATSPPSSASTRSSSSASRPPAQHHHFRGTGILVVHDPGQVTGKLPGSCHFRDHEQLPDRHCNPGGIDPAITQANIASTICMPGYTDGVRPPESQTENFKFNDAYPAYGVPSTATGELDHLIPLELGGDNDAANLWPEIGKLPNPKDGVENALHKAVCSRQVSLAHAREVIAANWVTAESVLGISSSTPEPTPAPVPTHSSAPSGCHPRTPSGNCYEPGEFCASSQHNETGVAGDGKMITCLPPSSGNTWRWVSR